MFDKFHEECGVVGVIGIEEAAKFAYLCLYALQHRGQEGAGIVSFSSHEIISEKGKGLVSEIFSSEDLEKFKGNIAIGHNRYSTKGAFDLENVQPLVADINLCQLALAHNGNIVNIDKLKKEFVEDGSIFTSTSDSEIILHLMARFGKNNNFIESLIKSLKCVKGAYSFVVMTANQLIGARDPMGFRPLVLGRLKSGYVLVSETVALDLIEAEFVREIDPGEVVVIDNSGIKSLFPFEKTAQKLCIFEYIYFARPDSLIFGNYVYNVRKKLGVELAKQRFIDADIVIPVPDSGIVATLGYSEESKIPIEMALIRNHYVGRTFIEPSQSIRHFGVKLKLNTVKDLIKGKRVIVIDDSIVRGTTSRKIIKMLKGDGAKEVHMLISAPPICFPCFYGIDTPTRNELIAATHTLEEIRRYITADSLNYLSIEGLLKCAGNNSYCTACFSGNYPVI